MTECVVYCHPAYERIVIESDCPQMSNRLFRSYQKNYGYIVVEIDPNTYYKEFADGKKRGYMICSAHIFKHKAEAAATQLHKKKYDFINAHGLAAFGKRHEYYAVFERCDA